MTPYRSRHEVVQREIQNAEDALKKAIVFCPGLKKASLDNPSDVKAALITLARKVAELEHEWS
jgi:hypothetical protein